MKYCVSEYIVIVLSAKIFVCIRCELRKKRTVLIFQSNRSPHIRTVEVLRDCYKTGKALYTIVIKNSQGLTVCHCYKKQLLFMKMYKTKSHRKIRL